MSPSCPISCRRVDTNVVRLISLQVFLFTLFFAFTHSFAFIVVVLFDFTVRLLREEKLSPFLIVAQFILKYWNTTPHYTDESPKRFALFLGLLIAGVITVLSLLGVMKIAVLIAFILILCAFFEVLFDFCIGCKIYYVLQLAKVINNDRNFN